MAVQLGMAVRASVAGWLGRGQEAGQRREICPATGAPLAAGGRAAGWRWHKPAVFGPAAGVSRCWWAGGAPLAVGPPAACRGARQVDAAVAAAPLLKRVFASVRRCLILYLELIFTSERRGLCRLLPGVEPAVAGRSNGAVGLRGATVPLCCCPCSLPLERQVAARWCKWWQYWFSSSSLAVPRTACGSQQAAAERRQRWSTRRCGGCGNSHSLGTWRLLLLAHQFARVVAADTGSPWGRALAGGGGLGGSQATSQAQQKREQREIERKLSNGDPVAPHCPPHRGTAGESQSGAGVSLRHPRLAGSLHTAAALPQGAHQGNPAQLFCFWGPGRQPAASKYGVGSGGCEYAAATAREARW